jgi:toxin ParE1/3/4
MAENKYSVEFTVKAGADLEQIYLYIANDLFNPDAAQRLLDKFEKHIMILRSYPFSSNVVQDTFLQKKGYRKLVVENYLVFYLVDEISNKVRVMRVLYGAQQYERYL